MVIITNNGKVIIIKVILITKEVVGAIIIKEVEEVITIKEVEEEIKKIKRTMLLS